MADEEVQLRPQALQEYIGQEQIKGNLADDIYASLVGGHEMKDIMLQGPPGLGKTTLARIIAMELEADMHEASGPSISDIPTLIGVLRRLKRYDVLFIDEIHAMPKKVEEALYPVMEDGVLYWTSEGRNRQQKMPPLTIVGATTRPDRISQPLRDRFGETYHLQYYTATEMEDIVARSASLLELEIEGEAIEEIARRSRSTPRVANRLLKNVRDYALVRNSNLTAEVACAALDARHVDVMGLDEQDQQILQLLHTQNRPIGLSTIAAAMNTEPAAIETIHEPYLMRLNFIERTFRGRIITQHGRAHLKRVRKVAA